MKATQKIIVSVFALFAIGCSSILDVKQESTITGNDYWNAPGDVSGYLTGIYDSFRGGEGTGAGGVMNTTFWLEDRGDSFEVGLESGVSNAWQQNLNNANAPNWLDLYAVIQQCNMLLKYAPGISYTVETDRNRAMAEALFIRAYTYFILVRAYGDAPLELEPTESDNKLAPARSPAAQVLQQVLADVDQALSLFPETGYVDKTRASRPSALALRADALLWKAKVLNGSDQDLNDAIAALDEVLVTVSPVADFGSIFATGNKNNAEIVFALHFERNEKSDQYGSRLKPRDIFVQSAANVAQIPYAKNGARSVYAPSAKLEALFDQNPADQRKAASIIRAVAANGSLIGIFDNKFAGTLYDDDRYFENDIILYRWGGLVLMKAEALAALGRSGDAVIELNKVRNRAGTGDYSGSTAKATLEKAILDEEFRETYFELKRWPDLMRFHAEGVIDLYNEVPNLAGNRLPLYFPIPQAQIDLDPALTQTDGYQN